MQYRTLAKTYETLEETPSKLKKADIIAELLKYTPTDLLDKVVLLVSGKVFPEWSEHVTGVADKLVIKAISKATGTSSENVVKSFKKTGDLGLTAEDLVQGKKQRTLGAKDATVEIVFKNLQALAEQEGKGSQEKKLNLIAELLSGADPLEARYIIRTSLGQLRVGVAKGIIRDAIAKAFDVDKKDVEKAWHMNPNYGVIAKIAHKDGIKGLQKVGLVIGEPFQVLLAEKIPELKDAIEKYDNVLLEFKYDGLRTVIHKDGDQVWIFTRNLENITKQFPDIVKLVQQNVKVKSCILDAETVGLTSAGKPIPFQKLSTRIKRKYDIEKQSKEIPIQVNLFDIVFLDGKVLMDHSLEERRKILTKSIKVKKGKFQKTESLITKKLKDAEKFYKRAISEGHEGLIAKNLEAKYVSGRRVAGGWLKIKPVMENLDVVVIGGVWGTGKRAGTLGSLILGIRSGDKFLPCGKMGTGLKEKESETGTTLKQITKLLKPYIIEEHGNEVAIKPKVVIEVAYEEIQKSPQYESGFALRFPRFLRLRDDKNPEQADDIKRINVLYKQQKGKR